MDSTTMGADALALVGRGRACYARREWDDAFVALSQADAASPLEPGDLEPLAMSAALTGRDADMLAALERLHLAHVAAGQCARAARAAFWLAFRLLAMGQAARGSGWLARARRLVERAGGECAESGYLLVASAARHLGAGAFDRAHADAGRAADIGERLTEPDLVALARSTQGRAAIRRGEVGSGLTLLDEAMVAVSTGEVLPLVAGLVYCSAITTCQQACALDRAREWTSALARWCGSQPQLVTFTGACLVHRAEILRLGGEWARAIEEARHACERASGGDGEALKDGLYEEAEIHRLRGELGEAEEAYRRSSQLGREPQPGLALLRLAQGRRAEAAGAIRRVLATTSSAWKRARLLPASVEILLASGEIEEARSAAHELEELARLFSTEALGAMAAHARGAVRLADGDAQGSVEPLRSAFETWQRLGAPYVAAKIRALLGHAYLALGDPDGARLERDAARGVFQRLGAAPDLAAVGAPLAKAAPARPHGLSRRELEVLRFVASGRTNKAIGKDLCISERTIDRHVSNIFAKLHVSSRAAATAFAYEHDLV